MDPSLTEFNWPSFAEMAVAMGGDGVIVRSAEDLESAIAKIDGATRPLLIELCLDPENVPRMRA
jgi:thiamine pyrophosphate-dependent acetolactate synthase large subunit-like protein